MVLVPKVNPVRPTASKPAANSRMAGDTGKVEELANQISEFKVCSLFLVFVLCRKSCLIM